MPQTKSRERAMIEQRLMHKGIGLESWGTDPDDGSPVANLGPWRVLVEDDSAGLYDGDEGILYAQVVGAAGFANEHVRFEFVPDGMDGGVEALPFEDVEPI